MNPGSSLCGWRMALRDEEAGRDAQRPLGPGGSLMRGLTSTVYSLSPHEASTAQAARPGMRGDRPLRVRVPSYAGVNKSVSMAIATLMLHFITFAKVSLG